MLSWVTSLFGFEGEAAKAEVAPEDEAMRRLNGWAWGLMLTACTQTVVETVPVPIPTIIPSAVFDGAALQRAIGEEPLLGEGGTIADGPSELDGIEAPRTNAVPEGDDFEGDAPAQAKPVVLVKRLFKPATAVTKPTPPSDWDEAEIVDERADDFESADCEAGAEGEEDFSAFDGADDWDEAEDFEGDYQAGSHWGTWTEEGWDHEWEPGWTPVAERPSRPSRPGWGNDRPAPVQPGHPVVPWYPAQPAYAVVPSHDSRPNRPDRERPNRPDRERPVHEARPDRERPSQDKHPDRERPVHEVRPDRERAIPPVVTEPSPGRSDQLERARRAEEAQREEARRLQREEVRQAAEVAREEARKAAEAQREEARRLQQEEARQAAKTQREAAREAAAAQRDEARRLQQEETKEKGEAEPVEDAQRAQQKEAEQKAEALREEESRSEEQARRDAKARREQATRRQDDQSREPAKPTENENNRASCNPRDASCRRR